jgi:hypothetical protein
MKCWTCVVDGVTAMHVFDEVTWTILGGLALVCLIACLYVLAKYSERERTVIELRSQVRRLRAEHAEYLDSIEAERAAELIARASDSKAA